MGSRTPHSWRSWRRCGERTVSELVVATGLSQPNASAHLACLHGCGLVEREPRGRFVAYRLRDERVAALLGLGEEVLADVAANVYTCTRYEATAAAKEVRP